MKPPGLCQEAEDIEEFKHENNPKHTSKSTKEWLQKKENKSVRMAQSDPRPQSHRKPVEWPKEGSAQEIHPQFDGA